LLQAVLEEFAAIAETLQQARGEGEVSEAAPAAE
jgi:type I restriction enzyme M protein